MTAAAGPLDIRCGRKAHTVNVQDDGRYMKRSLIIICVVCVSVLVLFAVGYSYQRYNLQREREEVARYAQVIANSLWRLDRDSPAEFLSLIARREYYRRLVVYDIDGSVFLEVGGEIKGWLDQVMMKCGLMGPTEISADIVYQGKPIGRLSATWYSSSIYFYLYSIVVVLLVLTALWFFIRTLEAKRTLEANVRDRTRDLRETNRSLQAEIAEREQMERALRESEGKLRTVLDANPDPLVVYDIEGRITYFNPAFTAVFGWTLEERIGKRMDDFVPEENWPETRKMIEKVRAGERFSGVETRRYTKSRKIVPVSVSGAIYRDNKGNPNGSVINLRDISEQKRLEDEFRQAQKMEAIGTLAGGIAHDFNNILQAIGGYVQLLHRNPSLNDRARTQLDQIGHATERASGLVKRLLSFSRKAEPRLKPVDLNREVCQTVELLERTIPKMITITTNLAPDLEPVRLDPDQLAQLLMNLGANARDAMPQGGILSIETRSLQLEPGDALMDMKPGRYVQLRFSDTGVGMPPGAGAYLRPLLHHQGSGAGHRAGLVLGLRHREKPPGLYHL